MTAPRPDARQAALDSYARFQQRMADPAYAAHVHAIVAEAPPLSEEQRHTLAGIFHGTLPPRQTRKAAS